jgi:hypothetical protein
VLFHEWRENEETWTGIPDELRGQLELTIGAGNPTDAQTLARAIYISRLHLFWNADRDWTITWMYSLLDWSTSRDTAAPLWPAYVMGSRWNDQMLAGGLLEQYLAAAGEQASTDLDVRRAMAGHLAAISLQSTLDLPAANWLGRLTNASDEESRADWLDEVGNLLRQGVADPEEQWQRWIATYLDQRVRSIPIALTDREASAATEIVVQLDASFPDAVTLLERTGANFNNDRLVLHHLETDKAEAYPEATARIVVHMLTGTTSGSFYDYRGLKRIFDATTGKIDPELLKQFRERTAALGFTDALNW